MVTFVSMTISKTRIFAITALALILIAFFTNPSKEQHEQAIKTKAIELLRAEAGTKNQDVVDFGIQLLGRTLVDQFMKTHVHIDNYYLFSLTKIRWNNQETIIGGGALKHIWFSPKIDEKASEIVSIIRGR